MFTYVNSMFPHVNSMFRRKMKNLPSSWNVTKQFHVYSKIVPICAFLVHKKQHSMFYHQQNPICTFLVNFEYTYVNSMFSHVNSMFRRKMKNLPSSWNVTKQFHVYPRQFLFRHSWFTKNNIPCFTTNRIRFVHTWFTLNKLM